MRNENRPKLIRKQIPEPKKKNRVGERHIKGEIERPRKYRTQSSIENTSTSVSTNHSNLNLHGVSDCFLQS